MELNNASIIKKTQIIDEFIDIILTREITRSIYYEEHISIEDIIKYVKLFFKNYDVAYYKRFLQTLKSKKVVFDLLCDSIYDISDDSININCSNTIRDASILVHEFVHSQNVKQDKDSYNNPFRELLSIMHEKMFSDYLKNNCDIANFKDPIIIRMQSDIDMSDQLKLGIEIYKSKRKNNSAIKDTSLEQVAFFNDFCIQDIDDYAYYLIGSVFSSYIHQNTLSKNFSINDLKHIRDFIINKNYADLAKILNLDFSYDLDGFNITRESIKSLRKEHIKEVMYYER